MRSSSDATPLLDELSDRLAVTDLVHRLGVCLDEHRFDALDDVLTEDVTAATPGGEATGRPAVVAQAVRNHADFTGLQHVITNVLVDLAGDAATARANVVGTFVRGGSRPARQLGAVYRFRARRGPKGWRLAGIEVRPTWRVDTDTPG
ncbi:nuclear transport factor 2 family protein [Modestobacter altitudinis]|uniref:nuclear transport factor 2 family protein n=1 Tax=Modestobacter altitudinis TaxID=2213158 RepID=UPI001486CC94|nr:nuclear transport factor 2 family protein [Modestobacter altitudinis]